MKYIKNAWLHFYTITLHKWRVMCLCFRCGLYYQGICHDLSKYSWVEFVVGVKYFQGDRSPNAVEIQEKGYSSAWLHHKGRNKHHWEYWVNFVDGKSIPTKMPIPYVIEMFCDRVSANMTYDKDLYKDANPYLYYQRNIEELIMHPQTQQLLEFLLWFLKENGLHASIQYIKKVVKIEGYSHDYIIEEKKR